MAIPFRFDAARHLYVALDTGEELQHITGMLARTGWIDDTWYTEEASRRGTAVHDLTAAYDLGGLDLEACDSPYRGYLLGHVKAMAALRPEFLEVEQPAVHPRHRYAGRPDRVLRLWEALAVCEVKTGAAGDDRAHGIQTALQVLLRADEHNLPPEAWQRFALYLSDKGKFKLKQHKDRADFDEARRVIRRCC